LAKYLNAWDEKPDLVSLGSQKNFENFMKDLLVGNGDNTFTLPDVADYKKMIAKAIVFKKTQALVRPMFSAFQANVTAYLVALLSNRLGRRLDLARIWEQQEISPELREQLRIWATDVNRVLHETAAGRMVSEWAKKAECWQVVRDARYPQASEEIPELRAP
jgi:hypothetical protein